MHIVVWGMFKVGSTTIYNSLKDSCPDSIQVKKSHTEINTLLDQDVDIAIVPFRKNTLKQWMSAYFMDIEKPEYPYSPFNRKLACFSHLSSGLRKEIIKMVDPRILVEDFNLINWRQFEWLNMDLTLNLLKTQFSFTQAPSLSAAVEIIPGTRRRDGKPLQFIFIQTEEISEPNLRGALAQFLPADVINQIHVVNSNIGTENWYGDQYREFLNCMAE